MIESIFSKFRGAIRGRETRRGTPQSTTVESARAADDKLLMDLHNPDPKVRRSAEIQVTRDLHDEAIKVGLKPAPLTSEFLTPEERRARNAFAQIIDRKNQ